MAPMVRQGNEDPAPPADGLDRGEILDAGRPEDVQARKWNGDGAAIAELIRRFENVEQQLGEFHRRSAYRESVIDRLHEENQQLRSGISRMVLEPVIADLIRLHDQLDREVRRLEADGQDGRLLGSFAEDVLQILDRCGIDVFSAQHGGTGRRGRLCRARHRPNPPPCPCAVPPVLPRPRRGRARRHQYSPGHDEAGPGANVTHSQ